MRDSVTAILIFVTDRPNIVRSGCRHTVEPIIRSRVRRLDFGPRRTVPMQGERLIGEVPLFVITHGPYITRACGGNAVEGIIGARGRRRHCRPGMPVPMLG